MPRSKAGRVKNPPSVRVGQHEKKYVNRVEPSHQRCKKTFLPSLTSDQVQYLRSTLFTEFYEFVWNQMVMRGINYMYHEFAIKFPKAGGPYAENPEENARLTYLHKEKIRRVLYREAARSYGFRGGVGELMLIDSFAHPIPQEEYKNAPDTRVDVKAPEFREVRWMSMEAAWLFMSDEVLEGYHRNIFDREGINFRLRKWSGKVYRHNWIEDGDLSISM